MFEMTAFTKTEASDRLGRARPWLLLPVGNPPERQSVAEFSGGDEAVATDEFDACFRSYERARRCDGGCS